MPSPIGNTTERPRSPRRPPDWRALLIVLATLFAGGTLTLELVDSDGDRIPDGARVIVQEAPSAPQVPATAPVDGPDADGRRDDTITVPPAAADRLEQDLEAGQSELDDPLRQPNDTPATATVPGPLASDELAGCRTRFVGNSSSRGGIRPSLIFLHQTVSRENGWASQDALTGLASRLSSGVSWHALVGRSGGLCTYTVPLALKAWTQANANPYAVGIEVEAYGNEGAYVTGAGKRRLVAVVRAIAKRYSIPLQRGQLNPLTCRPITPGIVEHSDGGACSGGHVDVTLAPADAASYIARLARSSSSTTADPRQPSSYPLGRLLAGERRNATCLLLERRVEHRHGGWAKVDRAHLDRARGCKRALEARARELERPGAAGLRRPERRSIIRKVVAGKP